VRGEATLEIVDTEAAVIREAAERILAGWSLVAIARDWNDRDIPRRRGGKAWSEKTVRQVVTKPSVAGIRVHKGTSRRATWAPILGESTWQAVRATLDARWAAQARGRARRRFLLTGGVATCGRCGAGLIAQQRKYSGRTVPYYLCPSPTRGGCSRLGVVAEPFEDYVAGMLLDELDKAAMHEALAHDDHEIQRAALMQDLTAVDVRRADLARRWATGALSGDEWDAAKAGLVAEQTRLSADLAALPPPAVDVDPQVIRAGWEAMTLDEHRQIIDMFITKVIVAPAKPGARAFDPGRVTVEWGTQ
jgi:hypothetical protein